MVVVGMSHEHAMNVSFPSVQLGWRSSMRWPQPKRHVVPMPSNSRRSFGSSIEPGPGGPRSSMIAGSEKTSVRANTLKLTSSSKVRTVHSGERNTMYPSARRIVGPWT